VTPEASTPLQFFDALSNAGVLKGPSWGPWRAFLAALFGLPLSEAEAAIYRTCTGRDALPSAPYDEGWLVCGRRSGKSFVLSLIAVFLAVFRDHRPYLAVGEKATIPIISTDRSQSRTIVRYIKAMLAVDDEVRALVQRETATAIELSNAVVLEVHTASYRRTRGFAIAACLCDELSFWPSSDDAAEPDYEILNAIRPAMVQFPNALLLCASSPYGKRGSLYDAHQRYFGVDDPAVLVWKAGTRVMNPSVPQRTIDLAMQRDPASAMAEFYAQFRDDVLQFIERELVEAAVDQGVLVRPPHSGLRYMGFADPSGGRGDSFTLGIAHRADDGAIILDCLVERMSPFNPSEATAQMAATLREYGISQVFGDRYAASWTSECFSANGIKYVASDRDRSAIYADALPLLTSGRCRLLDHEGLVAQLCNLERKTTSHGDRIDHPRGAHDDLANSACGVLTIASTTRYDPRPAQFASWGHPVPVRFEPTRLQREAALWSVPSTIAPDPVDPEGISRTFPREFLK
jgi:hypothetical protein